MKIKNVFFMSMLCFLMSFAAIFAASEKVEVPTLSKEEEKILLSSPLYKYTPITIAMKYYKEHPHILDYALSTAIENSAYKNDPKEISKMLTTELKKLVFDPIDLNKEDRVRIFKKVFELFRKNYIHDPYMGFSRQAQIDAIVRYAEEQGLIDVLSELKNLGINVPEQFFNVAKTDKTDAAGVPKLSKEEEKILFSSPLYKYNPITIAMEYYKEHPHILDYALSTAVENSAYKNNPKATSEMLTEELSKLPSYLRDLNQEDRVRIFKKVFELFRKNYIHDPYVASFREGQRAAIVSYAAEQGLIDVLSELKNLGINILTGIVDAAKVDKTDVMEFIAKIYSKEAAFKNIEGSVLRRVISAKAFNILAPYVSKEGLIALDDPRRGFGGWNQPWLQTQIKMLSSKEAEPSFNPLLIEAVLKKLKSIEHISSVNKTDSEGYTPLCRMLEIMIDEKADVLAKKKAKDVAQILLDYGAVCDRKDQKMQKALEELKALRVDVSLQGSEQALSSDIIDLIHQYTGAKQPNQ